MPTIDSTTLLRPFVDELNNITDRWLAFLQHADDDLVAALATEVTGRTAADVAHVAAADPHTGYQKESEKNIASGYAGLDASSKLTGSQQVYGTAADTALVGTTKLDELTAPTDVTTLNASTTAHGLLRKLSNVVTEYLDGTGSWSSPGILSAGTWTPVLKFGGGTTGITYSTQIGSYERRVSSTGDWITANCIIVLSSKGSSTGDATITGLPAAASHLTPGSLLPNGLTGVGGGVAADVGAGATTVQLWDTTTGGISALTDASFTNTALIAISITYKVS